ncbi:MAG: hypothetical protein AUK31_01710 [Fibrobacteres bacterium CG2_30_45_31]|nr:MAG: hypothetical protein AUK31_01710 [Fibrobacteres bacterium CG2_30_45_31]
MGKREFIMNTISPETTLIAFSRNHFEICLSIIEYENQPSILVLKDDRPSVERPIILGLREDFGKMLHDVLLAYYESPLYFDHIYWDYGKLQKLSKALGYFGEPEDELDPAVKQIIPDECIGDKTEDEVFESSWICAIGSRNYFNLVYYGKLRAEDFPLGNKRTFLKRIEIQE